MFLVIDGDNLENMEGVSLQAVTLADGSTAYIQHSSKGTYLPHGPVVVCSSSLAQSWNTSQSLLKTLSCIWCF